MTKEEKEEVQRILAMSNEEIQEENRKRAAKTVVPLLQDDQESEETYIDKYSGSQYDHLFDTDLIKDVLKQKYNVEIKDTMIRNLCNSGLMLLPDPVMKEYHPNVLAEIMTYLHLRDKNIQRFDLNMGEKNIVSRLNKTDIAYERLRFYFNMAVQHDRFIQRQYKKDTITINIPYDHINFCTNMSTQNKYWGIKMREPKMQMTGYNLQDYFDQELPQSEMAEYGMDYDTMCDIGENALKEDYCPYQKIFLALYTEIEEYLVEYWINWEKKWKEELGF